MQADRKISVNVGRAVTIAKISGSISVPGQLPNYPSLNQTFTLACYQLTVVGLGKG